jgi:hypothetical protein
MTGTRTALLCGTAVLSCAALVCSQRASHAELVARLDDLGKELHAQREQCAPARPQREEGDRGSPVAGGLRTDSETVGLLSAAVAQAVAARLAEARPPAPVEPSRGGAARQAGEPAAPAARPRTPEQEQQLRRAEALVDDVYSVHAVRPEAIAELRALGLTVGNTDEYRAQLLRLVSGYNRGELKPPAEGPALP